MKIKINKDGFLEIERAGKFKVVECSRCMEHSEYLGDENYNFPLYSRANIYYRPCGDWCSRFGEPRYEHRNKYIIDLCDKELVVEVYKVNDAALRSVRSLEGYDPNSTDNWFYDEVEVDTEFGKAKVYEYVSGREGRSLIEEGDWNKYRGIE